MDVTHIHLVILIPHMDLDQLQLVFGGGRQGFGGSGQALQVGGFQTAAAVAIKNQPACNGREIGPGLLDAVGVDPGGEHLAEGIGGGVFGIGMVTHAMLDMLQQPTVMVVEKEAQLADWR